MPSPSSIAHYKLATGRIFENQAAEIEEASIEILQPMLTPGRHGLPNTPGYEVETKIAGSTLIASATAAGKPLLRMWVVVDARDLGLAIPPPRQVDISVPACIVENLMDRPFDPSVGWLRELEPAMA
jgi:hypothetical protein